MSKRLKSKHKIDRRMGENIWGRPKSPVNTKSYGPGVHGQKRKGKLSDYRVQLWAKQKLKGYYGNITEKQFRIIYKAAERKRGDTGTNLIALLESRLDAAVYRAKFAITVFAARQMVSHGHVLVNGKRVTIASYRLREGDVVSLTEKAQALAVVLEAVKTDERDVPSYVEVDYSSYTAKLVRYPQQLEEVPYPVHMSPQLIVEFYAKN